MNKIHSKKHKMSIGFKIKKIREEKKLSQPELAHILDISQSTLSRIENRRLSKDIDFTLMDKICKFFEVDFSYFLDNGVINNFETAQNNNISRETGIVNNFPENIIEHVVKLVEENKTKEIKIKKLEQELRKRDS